MAIKVISFERDWRVPVFLRENWGDDFIVSRGKIYRGQDLPGLMILDAEKIIGLLTYHVEKDECEIVSLNALVENKGIGSVLIKDIVKLAKQKKCKRLWLITTNDSIDAMRFYQQKGFVFKKVYLNTMRLSRKIKPQIPKIGSYNIPIRDEIEFEYQLNAN